MQFGTRKAEAPERGSGVYLRRFKRGETRVRFLYNPDDWVEYWEHFTPDKKSFPCTRDKDTCPGCTSSNDDVAKASRKYATYLYLTKQEKVFPFSLPVSLADAFERRFERNDNTLLNRDYVVIRTGDGFDTKYDVDQEDKYPLDTEKLRKESPVSIDECFAEAFTEIWGEDALSGKPVSKPVAAVPDPDEVPPTEPTPAESEQVITEGQIRAMDKSELIDLCSRAGVTVTEDDTRGDLIDKLLAEFGE